LPVSSGVPEGGVGDGRIGRGSSSGDGDADDAPELGPLYNRFTDRPAGPLNRDIAVTRAEAEDVDQLAKVIAAAFHDLNASRFLIPDDDDRRKIYAGFFKLVYIEPGVQEGVVHRTADSLACAVWLPMGDSGSGHGDGGRGETEGLDTEGCVALGVSLFG